MPSKNITCLYCSKKFKRQTGKEFVHDESDHSLTVYRFGTTDYEVFLSKIYKICFESDFDQPFYNVFESKIESWSPGVWRIKNHFGINETNKNWTIHQWIDYVKNVELLK